jgi:serpin B
VKKTKIVSAFAAVTALATATACGTVSESESFSDSVSQADTTVSDVSQPSVTATGDSSLTSDSGEVSLGNTDYGDISDDFKNGFGDFSVNLFKSAALEDIESGENTLISPESALMALGMTENGANGETLAQMQNALCADMDTDDFNTNMLILKQNAESKNGVSFNIANSGWIKNSDCISPKESFTDIAKQFYGADVFLKAFDDDTANEINTWVSDSTNNMIPEIIDEISPESVAYIINAIAFESEWAEGYENSQIVEDGVFTSADGTQYTAVMLYSEESEYISDDNCVGFLKYYSGGDYAFMAILPDEDVTLSDYVSQMSGESLRNLFDSRQYGYTVYAQIPEFTYDYSLSLKPALQSMGMTLAFDRDNADFSNIADTLNPLYISDIKHKTFIQLDRNGTKAAAVTEIEMNEAEAISESVYVTLDRPFVYAIVDVKTELPIFIGTVNTV